MLGERDYVLRLVKQMAELLARALKLSSAAKPEEALTALRSACGEVLGMEYEVLSMLDAKTAIDLLGQPERVVAFARLLEAMGDVDDQAMRALTRYQHALEIIEALGGQSEIEARLREKLK